jgi:hypothetical protein
MNRSYYVVMIPVLLVTLGYVLVLRHMGIPPGYPRLIIAMTLFFGFIWYFGRRTTRKHKPDAQ